VIFRPMTSKADWLWFKQRTSVILCEDSEAIIAEDEHGIAGMVVFDTWTPSSVNVHMAIDRPACIRAGLFREVSVHAYIRRGKKRMFGLVPSNNERARRMDEKIGFTEVARVPDAVDDGVDYIVMRLDKENCKWLPEPVREVA
jgi:hypothetical protein